MSAMRETLRQTWAQTVYIHLFRQNADGDVVGSVHGSGVIFDASGHIITNEHVVCNGTQTAYAVELHDGTLLPARLVGVSRLTDIAILKVESPTPLTPVTFADSREVMAGDACFAIGMPFGERLKRSATFGHISAPKRFCPWHKASPVPYVQADLTLATGNSGGGLFDAQGRLIGINTFIFGSYEADSGLASGYTFSICADAVKWIAEHIIAHEFGPWRQKFGARLAPVSKALADAYGLPEKGGVIVNGVAFDSLAEKLDIKEGDVIWSVDGEVVFSPMMLVYSLMRASIQPVRLKVINRQGRCRTLPLTLPVRGRKSRAKALDCSGYNQVGLKLKKDVSGLGLLVVGVLPGSQASIAGVEGAEVINAYQNPATGTWQPLLTFKAFNAVLEENAGRVVVLRVMVEGEPTIMALTC